MIKKSMTYTDFLGETQTEDFFFHLTEADLIELEVAANGNSLSAWTAKISREENGEELVKIFKKIIAVSYGVKSTDGRRFRKSPELFDEFKSTQAYSDLFKQLSTDHEMAAEFINGIMPADIKPGTTVTPANNGGLTPSEVARKRSEELMQGRRAKAEPQKSTIERQPDLPVELPTAPPVLEAAPQNASDGEPDFSKMSREEVIAYYKNRG
jgi:hypothetical protein